MVDGSDAKVLFGFDAELAANASNHGEVMHGVADEELQLAAESGGLPVGGVDAAVHFNEQADGGLLFGDRFQASRELRSLLRRRWRFRFRGWARACARRNRLCHRSSHSKKSRSGRDSDEDDRQW